MANAPASVLQACPPQPPTLFPTTKPHAMGATGVGAGDWERKKGAREKVRACEGQNLSGRNISVDTPPSRITRQKYQHVLQYARQLVTFVWDKAISMLEELGEGRVTPTFAKTARGCSVALPGLPLPQ